MDMQKYTQIFNLNWGLQSTEVHTALKKDRGNKKKEEKETEMEKEEAGNGRGEGGGGGK